MQDYVPVSQMCSTEIKMLLCLLIQHGNGKSSERFCNFLSNALFMLLLLKGVTLQKF